MKKTIIFLALVAAVAVAATAKAVTLVSGTMITKWDATITKNASNKSNSDIVLKITAKTKTQPLTNEKLLSQICINVETKNYTLKANSTALKAFLIEYTCATACDTMAKMYATPPVIHYSATVAGSTAGAFQAKKTDWGAALTTMTFTQSSSETAGTVSGTFSGVTPTNANLYGFPNGTGKFYYRCFMLEDALATETALGSATDIEIATVYTKSGNATLGSNAYTVAGIFSVAASLVLFA